MARMRKLMILNCLLVLGELTRLSLQQNPLPTLGLEDGRITDAQINATGCWAPDNCISRSRLNTLFDAEGIGAWSPALANVNQHIQVDLLEFCDVIGVQTQGRNANGQWVKSFRVLSSQNGVAWTPVTSLSTGNEVFNGNTDRDTIVTNMFLTPVKARFIRINPVTWFTFISMRFELLGVPSTQALPTLGVADGRITDTQITASSCWGDYACTSRSRLNTLDMLDVGLPSGAWCAQNNDVNQHIQVDLLKFCDVIGVMTQGRNAYEPEQRVTSFRVLYSQNAVVWTPVTSSSTGIEVFNGNVDSDTIVTNLFVKPVKTRFMRINPVTWHEHISMRFELLGVSSKQVTTGMHFSMVADGASLNSTSVVENHVVGSLIKCAELCWRHGACKMFSHIQHERACFLGPVIFKGAAMLTGRQGARTFTHNEQ